MWKRQWWDGSLLGSALVLLGVTWNVAQAEPAAAIIDAAMKEGELKIIAMPHDGSRYGEVIDPLKKEYDSLKLNWQNCRPPTTMPKRGFRASRSRAKQGSHHQAMDSAVGAKVTAN